MAVSSAQFRKLALALPAAEEKSHFGKPDFRVLNKIFASLNPEGDQATLKMTPESQSQLLEVRPDVFSPAPGHWGRSGWTFVLLSPLGTAELRELLLDAWRQVAPKRLSTRATALGSNPTDGARRAASAGGADSARGARRAPKRDGRR